MLCNVYKVLAKSHVYNLLIQNLHVYLRNRLNLLLTKCDPVPSEIGDG